MLPRNFWIPNKFGVKGGIERGFSSFTTKKNMALGFSKADGPSQSSMLFEAQMGMVDRGADLSWLSQYPGEAEILFAPLTGMEVIGEPYVENGTVVIPLHLTCNMPDLTVDEILNKMKKVHMQVIDIAVADCLMMGFPKSSLTSLASQGGRADARERVVQQRRELQGGDPGGTAGKRYRYWRPDQQQQGLCECRRFTGSCLGMSCCFGGPACWCGQEAHH
jgi:hypothetical protein